MPGSFLPFLLLPSSSSSPSLMISCFAECYPVDMFDIFVPERNTQDGS